jgi:hypothetical protein
MLLRHNVGIDCLRGVTGEQPDYRDELQTCDNVNIFAAVQDPWLLSQSMNES